MTLQPTLATGAAATPLPGADALVVLASAVDGEVRIDDAGVLDEALRSAVLAGVAAVRWEGKPGTTVRLPLPDGAPWASAVLSAPKAGDAPAAVARGIRACTGAATVAVAASGDEVLRSALLATHALDTYRATVPTRVSTVTVLAADALERVQDEVRWTCWARDLVTQGPSDTNPQRTAQLIRDAAAEVGVEVRTIEVDELAELGCAGLLAVGQGSVNPPVLLRLHAPGSGDGTTAVVGKGLTYDSGGMNLKLAMLDVMKLDLGGAAAAAATVLHAASWPRAQALTVWLPLCENVMSGSAMITGDVLRMRNGVSVEVVNTDAEGRLVLADGLVLAGEEEPDRLLTIATLTGNSMVALGGRTAGLMTADDDLRADVLAAAEAAQESVWPMPELPFLAETLVSKIADTTNLGETKGQQMVASWFLRKFAPEGMPFAHLDVAGPAFNAGDPWDHVGHGGTGFGVRTLLELLDR